MLQHAMLADSYREHLSSNYLAKHDTAFSVTCLINTGPAISGHSEVITG